jgi:hypothetical protein
MLLYPLDSRHALLLLSFDSSYAGKESDERTKIPELCAENTGKQLQAAAGEVARKLSDTYRAMAGARKRLDPLWLPE